MECNYYKCEKCGFLHQVPAYWSGFDADEEMEMPHINLETKEMCDGILKHLFEQT